MVRGWEPPPGLDCRRPPEEMPPSPVPPPEQVGLGIVPLTLSEPTQMKGLKGLANGAPATSKPLQPLGCAPQPLSPNEQALPPQLEPAWPQGLRHNSASGRVGPAEYLSPDMQRQRKTKGKTKEQLAILKSFFLQCQWARREDYHKLEQITGLPRPEIIQWFGDTRYALKHGQLKWFRDNAVPGAPSFQDPAVPTPPPSTRSLNEWAETPPLPNPPPPPDIRPLEWYWATHQQLRESDIPQLSQASRLSTQQIMKMEGVQPLDENVGNVPGRRFLRNKLLLVASIIQGLGLLLCLTYICLHFYAQVPSQYPPIQSIRVQFTKCENENGFIITSPDADGTMKVQNNSIIITCDGFYLISLKGYFSQELSLRLLYRKGREPLFSLNMVKIVDSVTVAYLRFKDKVYLNMTTQNASCEDIQVNGGELILIHQNPGGFCVY
ncbi:hypothetical protein E5288_WYG004853 [Bos mutus]|nr:hypothetical protein [Bos mutus]